MAEILKPSDINKVWSNAGDNITPSDAKINGGWLVEIPPRQWFNWLDNKQDQAIAHINQHGIAVWDAVTEYQAGKSYVTGSNGKVYVAVQTNTNQNPTTDVSEVYWADLFKPGFAAFTAAGVSSWAVPAILKLGLKRAFVEVVGAGGGGGFRSTAPAASGGGQGGTSYKVVDLTGVTSVSVTVGASGAGGLTDPSNGTAGGSSSFGAFCSATGGGGGSSGGVALSASGGTGVGGDLNLVGGFSSPGVQSAASGIFGGAGGGFSSPAAASGAGATQPGHGGGGRTSGAGQSGGGGLVVIRW